MSEHSAAGTEKAPPGLAAMSEHDKHTAFLRTLIHYKDPGSCQDLQRRLKEAQLNERSVKRAVIAVCLLGLLSGSGICYSAVLLPEFFENGPHLVTKIFYTTGLGSGICLTAFLSFWAHHRRILRLLHEECRRFIVGTLQPDVPLALHTLTTVQSQNAQVYQIETPQDHLAATIVSLPKAS